MLRDIDKIHYKLDLNDEKKIGKAKVTSNITVNEEAFAHLDNITPTIDNAFIFSKNKNGIRK